MPQNRTKVPKAHLEKCGKAGISHIMKASAAALIKHVDGEVTVRRARVIPARECWLYENKAALNSVRRGLKQATEQRFAASPDLATAAELAGQLQDE